MSHTQTFFYLTSSTEQFSFGLPIAMINWLVLWRKTKSIWWYIDQKVFNHKHISESGFNTWFIVVDLLALLLFFRCLCLELKSFDNKNDGSSSPDENRFILNHVGWNQEESQKWCLVWRPTFLDALYITKSWTSEIKIVQLGPKQKFWF